MPASPRRRFASGVGVFSVVGTLLLSGTYVSLTVLAPLEPVVASVVVAPAETPVQPEVAFPGYGGSAVTAIGYPDVVLTHGSESPLQLASITKVITALIVLEAHPLGAGESGPSIQFGEYDVARYHYHLRNDGSNEPVWSGLRLTQRETLEAVLLSSANNYAESLAVWSFGSIDAFVARAHSWLSENGMPNTAVVEPSGLDPRNVSTVVDLLTLGRLALANPALAHIVAQPTAAVSRLGELKNSNRLLGLDGIDGIKTGTLDYYNLLFSSDLNLGEHTVTIVGAVLGASSREERDASVRQLVQSVREGFEWRVLTTAGRVMGTYSTAWGDEATAVTASEASALVWRGTAVTAEVTLDDIRVGDGSHLVGSVRFRVGQRIITVPVMLDGKIDDPGVWWRLTNPASLLD